MRRESGRGYADELAREIRRYVRLYLDTALAIPGRAERAALAHALHHGAGRVRDRDLHVLPLRGGGLGERVAEQVNARAGRRGHEDRAGELGAQRLAQRVALRTAQAIGLVEDEQRLAIG